MKMCVRLSHALLALTVSIVPGQLVRAQDGPAPTAPPSGAFVAQQCVERVQTVTQQTVGAVIVAVHNGVDRIETLDANGAPDGALVAAGAAARERVNDRAQGGRLRVTHLTGHCLQVLEHLDAPPAVRLVVIHAREQAFEVIGNARQSGIGAINAALESALAPAKG